MKVKASLGKVLEACRNKPLILVDESFWYLEALRNLNLK